MKNANQNECLDLINGIKILAAQTLQQAFLTRIVVVLLYNRDSETEIKIKCSFY